ncbi:uncharacterized protein LOC131682416 [Topomyia yanbarensis]|uniref:uncharacterized protein LOC131682416 n=1 Tax=Topomyia yanbarensis TaxID=2498891 RepID=UPI00273AEE23|nr:uncharacterized protein LOC131682416 [Topomyia yanbarensis]
MSHQKATACDATEDPDELSLLIKVEKTELHDPNNFTDDTFEKSQSLPPEEKDNTDTISTSAVQKRKRERRTYCAIAWEYLKLINGRYHCSIDPYSGCTYLQKTSLDLGNFIRHFRTMHPEQAHEKGLMVDSNLPFKKKRVIAKRSIAIDMQSVLEACIKLVTCHNLPLRCFEWTGLRLLLDPINAALGSPVNSSNIAEYLHAAAMRVIGRLKKSMMNKLVSIKIDSVSRQGRHVLIVNAQYEFNREAVFHTLGTIEVGENPTAKYLKCKVAKILRKYELTNDQIFLVISDNGANMVTGAKKMQRIFAETMLSNELVNENEVSDPSKEEELLEALSAELKEQYEVVRGTVHTLQLALDDVIQDSNPSIIEITNFTKMVRNVKYRQFFCINKATYPLLLLPGRWSGKFEMIQSIVKQRTFFASLGEQFPELALADDIWQFLLEYEAAFEPVHKVMELMQKEHHTFSDFYMQWLVAIKDIRALPNNRFSKQLVESLTKRLGSLKHNIIFKSALYFDPRFNYLNSAVFTADEKVDIQNYIISIWNRIGNIVPSGSSKDTTTTEPAATACNDDMDNFLTEMFGGTLTPSNSKSVETPVLQQIKVLEIEPRQPHNHDVWKHWVQRVGSHPELFAVAMVLLAIPSNQISVEKAFSTLAVVLSDLGDGITEQTLEDILIIKLNPSIFETVVPTLDDIRQKPQNS